jgi:hypothetical protein
VVSASTLGAPRPKPSTVYAPIALAELFVALNIPNSPKSVEISGAAYQTLQPFLDGGTAGFGDGDVLAAIVAVEAAWLEMLLKEDVERFGLRPTISRAARAHVLSSVVGWGHWLKPAF